MSEDPLARRRENAAKLLKWSSFGQARWPIGELDATGMAGMHLDGSRYPRLAAPSVIVVAISALAAAISTVAPARAEEKTNPLQSMLGAFGVQPGKDEDTIDYRPRAPLVVPPTRDLPEPKEAVRDPAWPKELDTDKRRKAAIDSRRPAPKSSASQDAEPAAEPPKTAAAAKPDEHEGECLLNGSGPKSCFNMLQSVFGGGSTEATKPGIEPKRKVLTEPPAGYRAATAAPKTGDGKSDGDTEPGPLDSFLQVFGMKKADDH